MKNVTFQAAVTLPWTLRLVESESGDSSWRRVRASCLVAFISYRLMRLLKIRST